ncbi:c-type cytochrome [Legionella quateirensis]|uniref:Cytochrome c5 n=1 Tax=Legionella quateirensis TaxID=45072 RepID=A0A378L525_9GAMM|nr:c-type cytochrome [Legionella quateirensis]KTD52801.1 cytochrome c5 [Legionella quateirensis]STY19220.1 cytochrome c5 [Legionella quateirensis]
MRLISVALLTVCSFSIFALDDIDRQQIQQRIQPIGKVRVQDQGNDTSETVTKNESTAKVENKEPGQETYEQYCIVCHRDGLAGAPKFRDKTDWAPRLSGRTIDELVSSATKGLNAMPPKGTCAECTEGDLKAAIQYMLPKS